MDTERIGPEGKGTEEKLRLEKKRLESLIEYSPLAIVSLDESHNIISCNRNFEEVFFFKEPEIQGRNLDEVIAREDYLEDAISYTKETLKGHTIHGSGKRYRKDGTLIDVEFFGVPVIVDGKVMGAYGIYRDISELVKTQAALREGEARYRSILEGIEEGYFEVDLAGNMTFFNEALCRLSGYSRGELMGMNNREYTTKENARRMYDIFNKIYRTGRPAIITDHEIIGKDGTTAVLEISATLMKDPAGEPIGFRGVVRDVTEKKRVEAELIRTKDFLQSIYDSSVDGITTTDLSGIVLHTSPMAKEILGYELDDLIGKKVYHFYEHGIEDAKKIMRELTTKGELRSHEMRFINKSGVLVDVSLSASLLRDEKGKVIGTLGIHRDITGRKKLQAQLQQAQKMEAIGTLAGGIAHDFNNILAAIIGYTELIGLRIKDEAKVRRYLQELRKAGNRAKDLTGQVLTFSRQSGEEEQPLYVSVILKEGLNLLRASLPSTIEIRQKIQVDSGKILANPTQVHQVLMNLCTNAAYAMREEGGVLEINLERIDVDSPTAALHPDLHPGPYVRLTVSDTGHGIPLENLERIFDPYFTTKEKGEGTGLGLSVVHGIVRSYGGAIEVNSEPGKGSTFQVYFPRIELDVKEIPRTVEPFPTGNERILFVDDEESLVEMGKEMLEHLGYSVVTKTSSIEALELLRKEPDVFDLLITDMTMPGMTGERLAKEVMKIRQDMPVILCSGFSDRIDRDKAKEIGIKRLTMKPLVMRDLAVIIRETLQ
ncbi:MAG: PAS domain S-box protein [Pseudomonadota bacterium]